MRCTICGLSSERGIGPSRGTRGLYAFASGARLGDVDPADGARDHEALDLGGAFEDRVDLRVAVPALDGVVTHVAGAAEDLDGVLGDPHGGLAREQLRHGTLAGGEGLAVRSHP